MNTTADIDRQAAAELAVLLQFDVLRTIKGFDFGSGQRGAEIIRRERSMNHETFMRSYALQAIINGHPREGVKLDTQTITELAAAAERLLVPRLRRVRNEMRRYRTPARVRAESALEATLWKFSPGKAY